VLLDLQVQLAVEAVDQLALLVISDQQVLLDLSDQQVLLEVVPQVSQDQLDLMDPRAPQDYKVI
jgi:hypothetical protein